MVRKYYVICKITYSVVSFIRRVCSPCFLFVRLFGFITRTKAPEGLGLGVNSIEISNKSKNAKCYVGTSYSSYNMSARFSTFSTLICLSGCLGSSLGQKPLKPLTPPSHAMSLSATFLLKRYCYRDLMFCQVFIEINHILFWQEVKCFLVP